MAVDRYPESRISPVLGLGLEGMSVNAADDMLILDTSVSPATFAGNITGFMLDRINVGNIGVGNTDLYTVPAGKRAIISLTAFNSTASPIVVSPRAKLSGSLVYTVVANGPTVAGLGSNTVPVRIVLEAGDVVALNTSATGMNVFGAALLFDATSCLKSPRVLSLTSGDNTIYTCPAATRSYFIGGTTWVYGSSSNPLMTIVNSSGSTQSYKVNIVPLGASPGLSNQIIAANSLANLDIVNPQLVVGMSAGDFVSVNTTGSGTQLVYLTIIEVPA